MQANTNQDTLSNFMCTLVEQLDKDRPGWKSNTIVQIDGAAWHKTAQVKSLLRKLDIQAIISAPYAFDSAVAELFFSMFKRGNINTQMLKTSKSKYKFILIPV